MSIKVVQTAILRQLQEDTDMDSAFSSPLTGTVSSSEKIVTGTGTLFLTEVVIDEFIGNITNGYRRVISITNDTTLEIEEDFNNDFNAEAIKATRIKPGMPKDFKLATYGQVLHIAFVSVADSIEALPADNVDAVYGFLVAMGFIEPNEIDAEQRKSDYDKMLKGAVYKDSTFNGIVLDNTKCGKFTVAEAPDSEGYYFGILPLVVTKTEDADNR